MAFQNFFAAKLFADIGSGDTTITLDTAPTATSGRMVLEARNPSQREVIKYTGVSGNQLTGVTRGQGGTSAKSHLKNALIEMNLTSEDIQDLYDAFASFAATNLTGWLTAVDVPTTVLYNGNRNYTLTYNGIDLTSLYSEGMRLRTTRAVAAPTQSASLNGTNHYFNDTSVAGMTITDDFVAGAWIKLTSYPPASGIVLSRYNGTSGWALQIDATGTVRLRGFNGGSGNESAVASFQAVPLNKWVHIAAQLDMSAFTATATTSYVMIDGVDVPAVVQRAGTNPTALVQAGNLEVGSWNGGLNPLPGKVVQAFVSSAKITQDNVRTLISQSITPAQVTAHSIISAWTLSGASGLTDINTTNANNLTAQNGATTTNADAPFGTQGSGLISSTLDHGVILSSTFSTNTTISLQLPEGSTIPTTGGVSAVEYSGFAVPYNFPALTKFRLSAFNTSTTKALALKISDDIISQATEPIKWQQSGNAGGSFYFILDSGRVTGYGFTSTLALAAAANTPYTINFPSGMFTEFHQFGIALGAGQATTNQYVGISGNAALTTTQAAFYFISTTNTAITATQTRAGYTFSGI